MKTPTPTTSSPPLSKLPRPLNLLEVYTKIVALMSQKGPAYPTNLLTLDADLHSTPDPEGRVLIRFTTQDEHELQAQVAILEDLVPNEPAVPPTLAPGITIEAELVEPKPTVAPTTPTGTATATSAPAAPAVAPTPTPVAPKAVLPPRNQAPKIKAPQTSTPAPAAPTKW